MRPASPRATASRPHVETDLRRRLFLIFKEALNNAVWHSGCTRVEARLTVEGSLVVLSVTDDGRGYDSLAAKSGQGLASMRARTTARGGTFHVDSAGGRGTRVTIRVPRRSG